MFKLLTATSVILALLFSVVPAAADDHRHRDRDRDSSRRFDQDDQRTYRWRRSYDDYSDYDEYHRPLTRIELIEALEHQGYYWVYSIRPSQKNNYITAFAYVGYSGRIVFLRINKYTGNVFFYRYV